MVEKKRFSLYGWNLSDWFKGNWTTIVETGKLILPLIIGLIVSNEYFIKYPQWIPVITSVITLFGKMGFDALHYFLVEKED